MLLLLCIMSDTDSNLENFSCHRQGWQQFWIEPRFSECEIRDHAGVVINFFRPWNFVHLPWLYRLYYPLCVSRRIDTWQIVYLSNKDPCPKLSIHKSEIKVTMDSDGNSQVSASTRWLTLAEPNLQLAAVHDRPCGH